MGNNKEEWRYIEGSIDCYVSNQGNLKQKSKEAELEIRQYYDAEGYLRASVPGIGRKRVHQFVAMAFLKNPENKPCINHIDGDKSRNWSDNLEYCTYKENSQHASKAGLLHSQDSKERPIVVTLVCENQSWVYKSQGLAAKVLGISDSEINKCLKNKRKTSHGYSFRYFDEEEQVLA